MSSNTSARTLWVKNLSQPSETATTNLFAPLGGSLRKVINTKDPTRQDVLIEFASEELASKALSTVQGSLVDGTRLIVEYAPTNLTAISSSIEKTFSQKGSVLDRIIKMSNTNHPKFDEKPEVQSSRKETAGNLKGETDSPVKDLTEHWKGEINGKSDKMEEIYDQENPSASQDGKLRKIISTKAQKHLDNNPLRRLVLIPKKKGSKRQEKKKQKKEVKLLIKRHPESILNLQPANVAAHTTSENLESKQDLSQNVKNKDTTDPLNAQNITQTDNQPKNELKMSKERSSSKNYNKSRRSPSNHNIRSRSRERSRSGSFYRSRSYRDHSYSNQRDHRYYDGSRYRDPSPHYRHRSRSTSSQRRYDYRSKPDYKRRSSRDFSPRRRSYSRSWSPRSRISPCGSRCCHSRSRSGSYNRSIDRSLSPNSRSRKLVIKKRDGSIRHNHAQRGERSLSRDRNRKRSDSRDRSRSKERLARNQYKQGPGTSNLRRDRNMSNKHAKGGNGYLKKRRGGKKKQNRRFNQNPKQEETAGSRNSAVVNMPEITTNTSQLSINYLIFPSLQNFFPNNMLDIPNAHANQQEGCSDTTLPSYLCPQAKPDHVGGFEAEGPESSYKDVNRLNLQSDHKFIYPKMEEHSNSFELSTIESKSHLADYDKTFDRPQTNSGSPERSKNVEVKAEEEGEKPKTDYLLTNELVSKNNLRSFINYLVATGDVQGLKEKLKTQRNQNKRLGKTKRRKRC